MGQGADTKERILQTALKEFSQHGYEGARMDKIASEVGITKASLYFHFKNKEEIFRVLFEMIIEKYHVKLKQIFEKSMGFTMKHRLIYIYKEYLEYHWHNTEMDFWNMVYYYPPVMMKEEIIKVTLHSKNDLIDNLIGVLAEGQKNKELQSLNLRSMAMSYYYLLTCISISTDLMDKDEYFSNMDACFDIFWNGIKGS